MYSKGYKGASSRIKRRNKKRVLFSRIFKILIPAAFLVAIIFVFRADFLQVKEVKVLNSSDTNPEEIRKIGENFIKGNYFFVIPKSNILFLDEKKLSLEILNIFSRLSEVKVSKNTDGSIEIEVRERVGSLLWCDGRHNCFLMQKDGLIFSEAKEAELLGKLAFGGVIEGDPMMRYFKNEKDISSHINVVEFLKKEGIETESVFLELSNKSVFETSIGKIFLNPEENMLKGASNAVLLAENARKKDPAVFFEYIDARFGNKVFYKTK